MTRKRKCKTNNKSQFKKEKKLLATRLIQISMKLDDYVYKDKQISTKDAALYIQEISAYKIHCHQDERSLQVIEKLTRCMQRIIADQNTLNDNNSTYISNYCPSPVYSLADDDITQLNKDTSITEHVTNPAVVEPKTVDLCDDKDDDIIQEHIEINVDVEIHRAISNLSIRDSGDTQGITMCSQSIEQNNLNVLNTNDKNTDCSQSILNNFDEQENIQGRIDLKSPQRNEDIKNLPNSSKRIVLKKSTLTGRPTATLEGFDKNKHPQKYTEETKLGHFEHNKINKIALNEFAAKKEPIKKKSRKRNTKIEPKKSNNGNNSCKKKINVDKTANSKLNNKHKKCQKEIENVDNNVNTQRKTIINSVTDKPIDMERAIPTYQINNTNTELLKTDPAPKTITHPVSNQSVPSIYNINVENDLSWMENIRYVREITPEERDTRLILDDSFWDNFTFPGNWSEQDFDYN